MAMVAALNVGDPEQREGVRWFLKNELHALQGSDRARMVKVALTIEEERGDGEDILDWGNMLDLPSRTAVMKRIGRLVSTSKRAKASQSQIDQELFELFTAEVARSPSPDYLPELSRIDVSRYPELSQAHPEQRVELLAAGLAIAKAHPSSARHVYSALERWVRDERVFHPELVVSFGNESSEKKLSRWQTTVSQFKALKPSAR